MKKKKNDFSNIAADKPFRALYLYMIYKERKSRRDRLCMAKAWTCYCDLNYTLFNLREEARNSHSKMRSRS